MGTHSMIRGGMVFLSLAAAMCVTAAPLRAADQPQGAPTTSQEVIEKSMPARAPASIETAPSSSRQEAVPGREVEKGHETPMKAPEDEGAMFLPLGLKGPDALDVEISREQDARSATSF
ncbi:MAG: hypothetical protein HZB35_03705 [Nitrospirae bacterium]|nr:hypothetical protein [Nitrospirota bacterium]